TLIELHPGDDIAAIVAASAPGETFLLTAGVYREQSFDPKSGQTFIGAEGAVLDGAALLSGWSASAQGQWSCSVSDLSSANAGNADLFVNGTLMNQVQSVADLTASSWYLDQATGRVILG